MANNKSWGIIINKVADFEIKKGITSFVNPHSMLILKENDPVASGVDYWYVDGISLVKLLGWLFNKKISRTSFDDTSIANMIFSGVAEKKQNIAIIGDEAEVVEKSVNFIEKKYNITIQFYRNGFMEDEEDLQQTINMLIDKKIEVVICGMGTPKQEEFLIKLKNTGWEGYGYTCGGYLHQIAQKNKEYYYPPFYDKMQLRWIYRMMDEPKLISRYFIQYPKFFNRLIAFRLKSKK
jgi:exopolysaccharide biosynthesis WecB/TagA/CpsF family protein